MGKSGQLYFDFDTYLRQGEPSQREKAIVWGTAIGLQKVDGLETSAYLQQTALKNIEGEITIDEAKELVNAYYISRQAHNEENEDKEEADRVATNIAKLLSSNTLAFSFFGYTQVHRNIFEGVFKHAGQIRDYDITKREWVLRGDTVNYMYAADLKRAVEYDLEQERMFDYGGLSTDEIIRHVSRFTANLWQIHAFCEGNTRTTAVFVIQYLRSMGFSVNNEIFARHSWYFRNAMVRYVYKNNEGVMPEPKYLERFFRNMLLGEQWDLRNRYLVINPPAEYAEQPRLNTPTSSTNTPTSTPTSSMQTEQVPNKYRTSTEQAPNLFYTDDKNTRDLVLTIGTGQLTVKEMMNGVGLKHRPNFLEQFLTPAISAGFVRMLYPNSPRHPKQKYKGIGLYNQLHNHPERIPNASRTNDITKIGTEKQLNKEE